MARPQVGITNRPPEHLLLAALDVTDRSPAGMRVALEGLENVIRRELNSDLDAPRGARGKDQPPAETGELGFEDDYDRGFLTVTLGLSSSAFDVLGTPAEERPQDLRPIPWELLGDSPADRRSGDLILQICSDDVYVCEHVLRRVEEEHGDALVVVWTQVGAQRYTTRTGRTSREEGRALNGFLDGTSNLNPRRNPSDAELVFINPDAVAGYPPNPPTEPGATGPYATLSAGPRFPADLQAPPAREPEWTRDGTYMTVRAATFDTRPWDRLSEGDQEHSVGRFKWSGSSLDLSDERANLDAEPAFAADQNNLTVPLDSHVRKAHPRRSPEDNLRRVFRRGYPLIAAGTDRLERGLAFVSFARTTSTQFEFIFRAWLRNPDFPQPGTGLDRLISGTLPETVLCGGYYYVPAIGRANEPWTWRLPGD